MKKKEESVVTQWCLTLCDPVDWSPPGSSVYRILQARKQNNKKRIKLKKKKNRKTKKEKKIQKNQTKTKQNKDKKKTKKKKKTN